MSVHEFDKEMLPDSEFEAGTLKFLVKENQARCLDDRRTPGIIEEIFYDIGMFRFRITKFEDKGDYWDLPIEKVTSFQFYLNSKTLTGVEIQNLNKVIEKYKEKLIIEPKIDKFLETEKLISETKIKIISWLKINSRFFKKYQKITLKKPYILLSKDLIAYLKQVGVYELETLTTKILVKNPSSGEWIKGLEICLAEMGLITYEGLKPRTKDIFTGLGDKSLRIKYLIHRIAFLRAYYELLGFTELSVYRGMATTSEWQSFPKTFISYTTDDKVAKSFFYT